MNYKRSVTIGITGRLIRKRLISGQTPSGRPVSMLTLMRPPCPPLIWRFHLPEPRQSGMRCGNSWSRSRKIVITGGGWPKNNKKSRNTGYQTDFGRVFSGDSHSNASTSHKATIEKSLMPQYISVPFTKGLLDLCRSSTPIIRIKKMSRYYVLVAGLLAFGGPAFSLTEQERSEIFNNVEHLCRHASNVGNVLAYEGDLNAGAILRFFGGSVSGRVNQTSWNNINQVYGDYRNDPTICRMEMLKILLPLFQGGSGHQSGSFSSQAGPGSATAATSTPNAGFAVYAGPNSASAASATQGGAHSSHSR